MARQQQLLQVVRHLLVVAHVDHLLVRDVVAGAVQAPRRAGRLVAGRRLQSLGQLQQLLWLDVRVRQQMGLQVRSLVETSLTHWATVRGLFVVENFVNWIGIPLDFIYFCAKERMRKGCIPASVRD